MNSILIIILLLALSAFFSGMEIAFVTANKLIIELERNKKTLSSRIITIFTKKPGYYITTMLIGNNIALVIYGIMMALILEPMISEFIDSDFIIMIIQTFISTIIILVTAEFLPKTLFRLNPNLALNIFAIPVYFFYLLFYPISLITMFFSKSIINKLLKGNYEEEETQKVFGKIDLNMLVKEEQHVHEVKQNIDNDIKIFRNVLDFSAIRLRECFVPRTEITALSIDASISEISDLFIETGYSRILIYRRNIDNIIGYIHSSQLFTLPKKLESILIPIIIVPETMPAHKLLKEFTKTNKGVALVVDEFGGTAGMLTIEDIMEEIFGEIEDEHDTNDTIDKQINDTEYILSGRVKIDYLNDKYNLGIPELDDYETVAGLILHHFESMPKKGDLIHVDNFSFKIIEASPNKIERIQLSVI